ncbi:MAG TPA: DNA-directed RNA polymerase subunit alpha [Rhabdochlamydiaceae bacterium]|nr:DNA-directed RNA polymerase subunit alpha [Rhabdochlamydiaceae bacterium]
MAVKYGKFELPAKIKVEETTKTDTYARFIAEPFERGFGHTVGNAIRRIMLTSLESPSIISIWIEGVPHEYMAVEGIVEDMTHIVLNLKGALLRKMPSDEESYSRDQKIISKVIDITPEVLDKNGGQYVVTLKDLAGNTDFDLVNPDLPIFTVTKPMTRKVDLKVAIGRGYVSSERHLIPDKSVDEIIIDSAFSPVRLVNYYVENTRVGQDTDYDRLILEVTTDGRIKPEEALSFATQIGILHLQVFEQLKLQSISFDKGEIEMNTDRDAIMSKLALKINEIELSVRSTNCLAGASIETIAELVVMPESEMLKFRNFGKKSLNEIKSKLEEMGLSLGMDLNKLGITRDNVKTVISEYLAEKVGKES